MGIRLNRYYHTCTNCGTPFRTNNKYGRRCQGCMRIAKIAGLNKLRTYWRTK